MNLKEQITADFKEAFKAKDTVRKNALASLNAEIKNKEIELNKREEGLSEEEVVAVVQSAVKKRKDAVEQFAKGGRSDLAEQEQAEIAVFEKYLPAQLSAAEVAEKVAEILAAAGIEEKSQMGQAMQAVMGQLKGQADGKMIKEAVDNFLQ